MSSRWTNKFAIMRDLSMVQGCVPVDVEGTVGATEKPPAPDLVEETEEEFYRKYTSGDDGSVLMPDFAPIKMFLDMVHDDSLSDGELENESERKIVVSKLNPMVPEYVPINLAAGENNNSRENDRNTEKTNNNKVKLNVSETITKDKIENAKSPIGDNMNGAFTSKMFKNNTKKVSQNGNGKESPIVMTSKDDSNVGKKVNKPKKKRNIAFESIFEMELKENMFVNRNDVTVDDTATPSVKEVKKPLKKVSPFLMDPSSMFKVKEGVRREQTTPTPVPKTEKQKVSSIKQYVPSKQADEYYKKYLERSQLAKQTREDIWERAERIMKEIDLKRKIEAEVQAFEESVAASKTENESTTVQAKDDITVTKANENTTDQAKDATTITKANENTTAKDNYDANKNKSDKSKDIVTKSGENATNQPNDDATSGSTNDTDNNNLPDTSSVSDFYSDNVVSSTSNSPPLCSTETSEGESSSSSEPKSALEPYLTTHRHSLNKHCIVCEVLCKRREGSNKKSIEVFQVENWRIRNDEDQGGSKELS